MRSKDDILRELVDVHGLPSSEAETKVHKRHMLLLETLLDIRTLLEPTAPSPKEKK